MRWVQRRVAADHGGLILDQQRSDARSADVDLAHGGDRGLRIGDGDRAGRARAGTDGDRSVGGEFGPGQHGAALTDQHRALASNADSHLVALAVDGGARSGDVQRGARTDFGANLDGGGAGGRDIRAVGLQQPSRADIDHTLAGLHQ